jgi:Mg-chelatase subunit ChlI|tara:strand:- start:170 stop:412 length:243 start_codon:yes stop_codon:yes gene_type:complete
MSDEQLANVLLDILSEGMFNDIYMRGDHNKNEVRRLMIEKGVSNEQVSVLQERFKIEADITFTEVLSTLISQLNPTINIP